MQEKTLILRYQKQICKLAKDTVICDCDQLDGDEYTGAENNYWQSFGNGSLATIVLLYGLWINTKYTRIRGRKLALTNLL